MKVELLLLIVTSCICGSLQLEDCEISSGLQRGPDAPDSLTASENCPEGRISWHYPSGELAITFPRSVFGTELDRSRMKVCFRGDIGEGVASLRETKTNQRGRQQTRTLPLPENREEWVCTRQSRSQDGISVTFVSTETERPKYYLKVIRYRVEKVEPRSGQRKNGGRRRNGKDRKQ